MKGRRTATTGSSGWAEINHWNPRPPPAQTVDFLVTAIFNSTQDATAVVQFETRAEPKDRVVWGSSCAGSG